MHTQPIGAPVAQLLTLMAVALCGVTAVSVCLAMLALIEDRLLAGLFAGAAVVLDLIKYAAWPLALGLLAWGATQRGADDGLRPNPGRRVGLGDL